MTNARKTTNKILDAVEEGVLDPTEMLKMALSWMSEADVAEMAERNDLFDREEEEG